MNKKTIRKITGALLIGIVAAGTATGCVGKDKKDKTTEPSVKVTDKIKKDEKKNTQVSSDAMIRQFMNLNGYRYEFVNGEAEFEIDKDKIGELVGKIETELKYEDPSTHGKDGASTLAVGGEIRELKGYNKDFRVVVIKDGKTYLCQKVAKVDDSEIKSSEYFKDGALGGKITGVDIKDHFGMESLKKITAEEAKDMLQAITEAKWGKFSNEEYEAMGSAQAGGKSFMLEMELKDGMNYTVYLIPSMNLVSVGDSTYRLNEDFNETFGKIFEGLKQGPAPMF